ncbi:MAG: hypothetical protein IMZ55_06290 [Acidobacteria bacterium]|nr:hypothetical protein [Acidobacteriota bacterium]
MPLDQILAWCAAIVGVGAAVTMLYKFVRWAASRAKNLDTFFEDWNGAPARPGVAAIPGVMARLDAQDGQMAMVGSRITNLERHVGNGNKVTLRHIVEGNCTDIKEIKGILGTRQVDVKRDSLARHLPTAKKRSTVKP